MAAAPGGEIPRAVRYVTPSVQGYSFVFPYLRLGLPVALLAALVGCGPDYSPNTYSTAAVQQANKVDQGVIAGFREVAIRSDGTVGAISGGAAGGVLGAQTPDGGVTTALSALCGTLIGGLVGASVEHAAGDTKAFEYVVRKTNGDLISLTQKDVTPLAIGLKVLVIEGKQARVVPDYSVPGDARAPSAADDTGKSENKTETKSGGLSAKSNTTDGTDKTEKATNGVTATDAPSDTGPAPAQAPQPAAVDTPPTPAGGEPDSAPASQPVAPRGPAPQAAATPAPQTTPAPAADPQPARADQDGSTPPAAPTQAPEPSDGNPTP
jgi:outer membrane lipoprotein SlyB